MVFVCPSYSREREKGQVLLIVILVMIVALTVGLSLISRSITNLRTSTEEAESQKALAAAEAGIEQALEKQGEDSFSGSFATGDSSVNYETDILEIRGSSFLINGGNSVPRDDGVDIWLSDYASDDTIFTTGQVSGNIDIYWGEDSTDCNNSALEISVITGTKNSPLLSRITVDPCATRRTHNNFAQPQAVTNPIIGGQQTDFRFTTRVVVSQGLIMRVIPIYHDTNMGLISNAALPLQGKLITSTGSTGKTQRSINVFQGFPKIPAELFPYAIFSPQ